MVVAASAPTRPPHNLIASLVPLVSREREHRQVVERLLDPACRLITIVGVGGAGKTRLAQETARACVWAEHAGAPFCHGVYFVPLASVAPREQPGDQVIAAAIAQTLGLAAPAAATVDGLCQHLQGRDLLLVLDSVEHLKDEISFIPTLLQRAPRLTILLTSRVRLGLLSEAVVALGGLDYDTPDPLGQGASPAADLFVRAARAVAPDFAPTPDNRAAIARICRLVAGLPLGIRLASMWVNVLSCGEIADEIARDLDFLSSSAPDLSMRQRSLRAVFCDSWALLGADAQAGLCRLALLRGSFTREAAAAVAGVSLPLLVSLVNHSLVQRLGDTGRYAVLEPFRQYATERVAPQEAAEIARRHAAYYLGLLARCDARQAGPHQPQVPAALRPDLDHLHDAWRWAVAQRDRALLARAAHGLWRLHDACGLLREGEALFAAAAERMAPQLAEPGAQALRATILARQSWFLCQLGSPEAAWPLLEESLATAPDRADDDAVFILNACALQQVQVGGWARARALGEQGFALAQERGDRYGQLVACGLLGQAAQGCCDYAAAQAWLQRSLTEAQQLCDGWQVAGVLASLASLAAATGRHAEARALLQRCLAQREALQDIGGSAQCLCQLGDIAGALHEPAAAAAHYTEALRLSRRHGDDAGIAAALLRLGQLAAVQGQAEAAARLLYDGLYAALGRSDRLVRLGLQGAAALLRSRNDVVWASQLAQHLPRIELYAQARHLLAWLEPAARPVSLEAAIAAAPQSLEPAPAGAEPEPPSAAGATNLTGREVAVLRLVAQGLTDGQVAEKLAVSPRTVGTHLSSIYSKLQVRSRSAATRFAVEHGLV